MLLNCWLKQTHFLKHKTNKTFIYLPFLFLRLFIEAASNVGISSSTSSPSSIDSPSEFNCENKAYIIIYEIKGCIWIKPTWSDINLKTECSFVLSQPLKSSPILSKLKRSLAQNQIDGKSLLCRQANASRFNNIYKNKLNIFIKTLNTLNKIILKQTCS